MLDEVWRSSNLISTTKKATPLKTKKPKRSKIRPSPTKSELGFEFKKTKFRRLACGFCDRARPIPHPGQAQPWISREFPWWKKIRFGFRFEKKNRFLGEQHWRPPSHRSNSCCKKKSNCDQNGPKSARRRVGKKSMITPACTVRGRQDPGSQFQLNCSLAAISSQKKRQNSNQKNRIKNN